MILGMQEQLTEPNEDKTSKVNGSVDFREEKEKENNKLLTLVVLKPPLLPLKIDYFEKNIEIQFLL